jgi:hypothetical protein
MWWPVATSRELEPTGIEVMARSGVQGMAVDSRGDVWLHGPWLVARVNPTTGAATVWDVSDDQAFAGVTALRPSSATGVWLVTEDRLRLFDGKGFVHDLPVPEQYRGGPGGVITDMVEVGTEVWVSSAAGVARCAQGVWSFVAPQQLTRATLLEVDSTGSVWANGRLQAEDGPARAVVRFDGVGWESPGEDAGTGFADELVADAIGGLLVRYGFAVRRFDGTSWRTYSPYYMGRSVAVVAAADGSPWLLAEGSLLHFDASGRWRDVVEVRDPVDIALVDGQVMVAEGGGLLRVEGETARRVFTASSWLADLEGGRDTYPSDVKRRLLFVSSDEVWAMDEREAWRLSGGTRHVVNLPSPVAWGASPILASDGAVWVATEEGLVRIVGDEAELMRVIPPGEFLYPAPDGGVWVGPDPWFGWWYAEQAADGRFLDGRGVRLVRPDGSHTSIALPIDVWTVSALFPGTDGSLWASACEGGDAPEDCATAADLMRWDQHWSTVPYPGSGMVGVGAAGKAFWAFLRSDDLTVALPVLGRYAQGAWTTFPEVGQVESMVVAPDGSACGLAVVDPTLVCVDGDGQITRTPILLRGAIRIGRDGSVWLAAPGLVARLPVTVLGQRAGVSAASG